MTTMSLLRERGCFGPEALAIASEAFARSWGFIGRDPLFESYDRDNLRTELARVIFEMLDKDECNSLDIANHAIRRLRERMLIPENSLS
jgi:hypothetical protein